MRRAMPLLALSLLLLSACGGQPAPPASTPTIAASQPTATTAAAQPNPTADSGSAITPAPDAHGLKPGWIQGNVTYANGAPLTKVSVVMWGTTLAGSNTHFTTKVDSKGHYAQMVPDGIYEITAYVTTQYNGKRYNLWLHPTDNINTRSQSSVEGLQKDFEWLMSGETPYAETSPDSASAYYGGSIGLGTEGVFNMNYNNGKLVEPYEYPDGALIRIELEPNGPLMDGSEGKLLSYEMKPADVAAGVIRDVPLGSYTARATLREADGTETPLLVASVIPGGPYGEKIIPADTSKVEFGPSRMGDYGIEPMSLYVLPPDEAE